MKQSIGEFLATLRKAHGYTQQEVADKLGISNKTISAWERGTVLPDILILPVLAELYSVTTDEILAGERKAGNDGVKISAKSKTKLLKHKISEFTMQEYILVGVFFVGALLLFIGVYLDLVTFVWSGWEWWLLLLYIGLVTVIISFSVLLALFKKALGSTDEDLDEFPAYAIIIFRKFSLFIYFAAALALVLAFVSLILMSTGGPPIISNRRLILMIVCTLLAILLALSAFFIRDYALRKWNGNENATRRKKNGKLYTKVALFGLIPIAISISIAIIFCFLRFESTNEIYSADRETFIVYMESTVVNGQEYHIPLSELKNSSEYNVNYTYGNDVYYRFDTNGQCHLTINGSLYTANLIEGPDNFSVYNLRYNYLPLPSPATASLSTAHYKLYLNENIASFCYVTMDNYGSIAVSCAGAVIAFDIIACVAICIIKREKTEVKL